MQLRCFLLRSRNLALRLARDVLRDRAGGTGP